LFFNNCEGTKKRGPYSKIFARGIVGSIVASVLRECIAAIEGIAEKYVAVKEQVRGLGLVRVERRDEALDDLNGALKSHLQSSKMMVFFVTFFFF